MLLDGMFPPATGNLGQGLLQMLQYDFMQRALISGTALSIVAGLVGYFVLLRRQAFAGESLSDVAFTGALGGAVFGINPLAGMLALTMVAALAMGSFGQRLGERDIAVGTVLAWVLGLGVLFLTLSTRHGVRTGSGLSGVSVLFGSILSMSASQERAILLIGAAIVLTLAAIGRPLFFASLDPDVAAARGVPVRLLGLVFMILLAATVAEAVQAVGALLVFVLLLLPAATAQKLTLRPLSGLALSALLAVCFTWAGIVVAFYAGLPSSVCISLIAFAVYVLATVVRRLGLVPFARAVRRRATP
jgi:zinc/manganese transport system permease protein